MEREDGVQALAEIRQKLESPENDRDSLRSAYEALGKIVKIQSELAGEALKMVQQGLQYPENDGGSFRYICGVLGKIVENKPELSGEVLKTVQLGLQYPGGNRYFLRDVYEVLGKIKYQPELAGEVLKALQLGLQRPENNSDSLCDAYDVLGNIVAVQPELAGEVLKTMQQGVQHPENDRDSLKKAYEALGKIAARQSELAGEVLKALQLGLKHSKNDYMSLECVYKVLGKVAENKPELGGELLKTVQQGLQHSKNVGVSLLDAYEVLEKIVKNKPELAGEASKLFQQGLQHPENDDDSLRIAYQILGRIAENKPELAGEALKMVQQGLQHSKNEGYSLRGAYYVLEEIVKNKPELAGEVSKLFQQGLQHPENDVGSLCGAYEALGKIAENKPELAGEVLKAVQQGLQHPENGVGSLCSVYGALGKIAENKPELAGEVLKAVQQELQSPENIGSSLRSAYEALGKIVKIQPEFSQDVADTVLAEKVNSSMFKILAMCMKKCPVRDLAAKYPERETLIEAAAKMRFSSEWEMNYAYGVYEVEKIAKMSFSAQQRVMNVLVSELGKEQGIAQEELKKFRKGNNAEVEKMVAGNSDWLVPASFKAAEMFGCYFPNYLKKAQKAGLSTHDVVYWLPENMGKAKNESFSQFIRNNILYQANGKEYARPLGELSVIAHNWKTLTPEQEKMRYKDVLAVCMSKKYDNHKYDAFAMEAAKFGYPEEDYSNMEQIYQAGLSVPEPFDSSKRFEITSEGGTTYVGRFLPRDDPRVGFFGNYTDCCQHFEGAGNACAVSSVKDPYSQLFAIEDDKGRIIAGSWVWENTEGEYRDACFDNIEAIGKYASHPVINEIYGRVGEYLAKEAGCRYVTIGQGHQDADTSAYAPAKEPIPLPTQYHNGYSDARSQVILAHNPDAKPLDKEKESRRFIRDVCFLDENAMDMVAEKCFPESDQELMVPENMAGKVLVDSEKGVVGYCLWDEAEKSVYDMAVLPEYRKDKNASSTKLFLSVQQEIRKIGGEWTAELRDKTTYHYMKMMQARGLVKMDTLEVDHEMSDGSKVYQVRFTPLEKKRGARQQENAAENNGARADEASGQESQGKRFSDVQMATAVRARQGRNAG